MADKNVQLKRGQDNIYPKTKAELVEGLTQGGNPKPELIIKIDLRDEELYSHHTKGDYIADNTGKHTYDYNETGWYINAGKLTKVIETVFYPAYVILKTHTHTSYGYFINPPFPSEFFYRTADIIEPGYIYVNGIMDSEGHCTEFVCDVPLFALNYDYDGYGDSDYMGAFMWMIVPDTSTKDPVYLGFDYNTEIHSILVLYGI